MTEVVPIWSSWVEIYGAGNDEANGYYKRCEDHLGLPQWSKCGTSWRIFWGPCWTLGTGYHSGNDYHYSCELDDDAVDQAFEQSKWKLEDGEWVLGPSVWGHKWKMLAEAGVENATTMFAHKWQVCISGYEPPKHTGGVPPAPSIRAIPSTAVTVSLLGDGGCKKLTCSNMSGDELLLLDLDGPKEEELKLGSVRSLVVAKMSCDESANVCLLNAHGKILDTTCDLLRLEEALSLQPMAGDAGSIAQPLSGGCTEGQVSAAQPPRFKSSLEIEIGMKVVISSHYHTVMYQCRDIPELIEDSDEDRRALLGATVRITDLARSENCMPSITNDMIAVKRLGAPDEAEEIWFSVQALACNVYTVGLSTLEQAEIDAVHNENWSELMRIRRQMDSQEM